MQMVEETIKRNLKSQKLRESKLNKMLNHVKILSTYDFNKIALWTENVEVIKPQIKPPSTKITSRVGITDITIAFRLLRNASKYDILILHGGERVDLFYLMLKRLISFRRRPLHIIREPHWQVSKNLIIRFLQRLVIKSVAGIIDQVQVFSTEQIGICAALFWLPVDRFVAIPYSTSLRGYSFDIEAGDFLLTEGLSYRDYYPLVKAVSKMNVNLVIAVPSPEILGDLKINSNIEIRSDLDHLEFYRLMARCKAFVLPLKPNINRGAGDTTVLNAMLLHKPVIATKSYSTNIYVRHAKNGFLVKPANAKALVNAINDLYNYPKEQYEQMCQEAYHDAVVRFNPELRTIRMLESAINLFKLKDNKNVEIL